MLSVCTCVQAGPCKSQRSVAVPTQCGLPMATICLGGARIWTYSLSCYPCSLTCEALYLASFGIQFDVFSAQRLESLWWLLCCLLTSCICQTVCYGLSVRPCGMAGSPAVGLAWCDCLRRIRGKVLYSGQGLLLCMLLYAAACS